MKAKKPDRFERMVLAAMKKQDTPSSTCIWLNGPDVVKLLRKEHRAVVEMVQKELKKCVKASHTAIDLGWHCRAAQCKDILKLMQKRAT